MISRNLYIADKAKNVIIVKRGRDTGFSGIENARRLYSDGHRVKQL